MAPKWEALRRLTDDELIAAHDEIAKNTVVGLNYYRDEITRRAFERASAAAHELAAAALDEARQSRRLAKWNMLVAAVATIAAVAAIIVPFLA